MKEEISANFYHYFEMFRNMRHIADIPFVTGYESTLSHTENVLREVFDFSGNSPIFRT